MGGHYSSCTHPKSKCYHGGSPKAHVVRVAPPELTSKQKQLLRTAWEQLERDIADVGIITFLGMFETHPQVENIFMPFSGLTRTDEEYSKTLREHALRVMATVEKCIHRLDEPERMRTVLEALGGRHINYNAKIEYVDILGSQFVKAVKGNTPNWNTELENAWLSLVRIITFYIKHAWMDKQKQQLTREVTRKEYLASRRSRSEPVRTPGSLPLHQVNGDSSAPGSNKFSSMMVESSRPEPRPAENGYHSKSPRQSVDITAAGQEAGGEAGKDPKVHSQA